MGAGAIPVDVEAAFRQRQLKSTGLVIHTASFDYAGDDRLDVSFGSGNFVFAPPRPLLFDFRLGRLGCEQFQKQYAAFLRGSFAQHMYSWDCLLESSAIVLVCSCNGGEDTCHRFTLIEFLKQFGAVYCGDIAARRPTPPS